MKIPGVGGDKGKRAGSVDEKRSTFWTTPWSWRDNQGCYVGYNKEVWLYRELTPQPLEWEDSQTRLARGRQLHNLLTELGATLSLIHI